MLQKKPFLTFQRLATQLSDMNSLLVHNYMQINLQPLTVYLVISPGHFEAMIWKWLYYVILSILTVIHLLCLVLHACARMFFFCPTILGFYISPCMIALCISVFFVIGVAGCDK